MAFYNRLFFFVVLVYSQSCFGQDTLTRYFVIDSVSFEKNVDKKELYDGIYFTGLLISENSHRCFIENNWLNENTPNYFSKIKYLKSDSLKIGIVIDDKKSVIWLNHLENLSDTIHIQKWNLFHNQLQDSIKSWVGYYHWIDDSMISIYKQKTREYTTNNSSGNTRTRFQFILNNKSCEVVLKIEQENLLTWYHGYPSKRAEKKRFSKERAGKKHIRYNKFAGNIDKKQSIYVGSIGF